MLNISGIMRGRNENFVRQGGPQFKSQPGGSTSEAVAPKSA